MSSQKKENVYTRDFMLELFATDYSLPEDADTSLSAYLEEPRPPLANLPLSDLEKRLLSMVSINSEGNRRNNYQNNKKRPEKIAPVGAKRDKEDLWDMPNTNAGNFAAEGVFGYGAPSPFEKPAFPAEPARPLVTKNAWSVLEQAESPQLSQKGIEEPGFVNALPFSPSQQNRDAFKEPVGFGMIGKPDIVPPPMATFKFIPPQWVYEDPSGRIQGPFTSEQMHGWYKEGYFPPALPIKCVGDPQFISLVRFVEKYGNQSPFLDSLRDQEALERECFYQEQLRQQQMGGFRNPLGIDSPRIAGGMPMFGDSQLNAFNPVDAGIRPFGSPMRFNTPPVMGGFGQPQQRTDQQGLLQFMAQHQFEEPKYNAEPEVPVRAPSPQRQPSPVQEMKQTSRSPTFKASSPKSPAKQIEKFEEPERSPTPEPVKEEKVAKPKKKKEAAKKKVEVPVEEPEVVVTPVESKPAPWANIKKQDSSAALKAIQATELKEAQARKQREEKEAQARILAEAQALAQREAQTQVSGLPANSQWANSTVSKKKKTLQEIMEDEAKEKELMEKQNPNANAPKGYASTVAGNTTSKPINFAKIASSKPAPKEEEDGWNVVKKQQKPATPQPVVAKPAPKLNYTPQPVAQATNAQGQAPAQKKAVTNQTSQWCRNHLRNVGRDSSLNIDEFINILLSLDINENATITMICDDALGHSNLDSRKFADEFIKSRQAEMNGIVLNEDDGWTSVGSGVAKPPPQVQTKESIASENKFMIVGKTGKKKNKK